MPEEPILRLDRVGVAYGDVQVLWDVTMEVNEGELVALIGANGAGKTTTLKTISGLLKPLSGEIVFKGERIDRRPAYEMVELGIAHVPEGRQLFPDMTVEENLFIGSRPPRARGRRADLLTWVYELFPRLKERRGQLAGTLSGGEQQMCAIGRGLMSNPDVLMFDEPSLGLAPVLVQGVFEIVQKIRSEGVTVLLVEQNVKHSLSIADRAYVLENGSINLSGRGQDLLHDDHVRRAYLGI